MRDFDLPPAGTRDRRVCPTGPRAEPCMPRRPERLWRVAGLGLVLLAAPAAAVDVTDLALETVATDLDRLTAVTHAGDSRLFIALQAGLVVVYENGGFRDEPFLDIRDRVGNTHNADGLLGLAFHPDFGDNGFLFVNYTTPEHDWLIVRYQLGDDPDHVDPATEKVLLDVAKAAVSHYAGQLQFGPDGHLWIASGDSGPSFDPLCFAQEDDALEGKILRLDVDQNVDVPPYYGIPSDNPFVGSVTAREEIWAKGFRNPWRFSFDRETGDLYVGDVGQSTREEVDFEPAGSPGGLNYGWKRLEGTLCQSNEQGCQTPPPPCDSGIYTPPILEYEHGVGRCAVIGGYVYRGVEIPDLDGVYFYGDFCSGTIWAAERSGDGWQSEELPFRLGNQFITFGEDAAGELYLATRSTIWKLVAVTPPPTCVADATRLCLQGERFRVDVTWRSLQGQNGSGQAIPLTEDSGYFWFFSEDNPEIFVKVLDACAEPFHRFWVFAAGLTDVETRLTVVDTETGETRRYDKPLGAGFDPIRDTSAFATCP